LLAPAAEMADSSLAACTREMVLSSLRALPCVYYFFLAVVVVIRYETTATTRWALLFIVRAFFNDTVTVAIWTGFHAAFLYVFSRFGERKLVQSMYPPNRTRKHPTISTEKRAPV
jgi:hypothetical protein